jgi:hypothetical protein
MFLLSFLHDIRHALQLPYAHPSYKRTGRGGEMECIKLNVYIAGSSRGALFRRGIGVETRPQYVNK